LPNFHRPIIILKRWKVLVSLGVPVVGAVGFEPATPTMSTAAGDGQAVDFKELKGTRKGLG
jgi:hypothetical protein